MDILKTCCRCKENKPIGLFHLCKNEKDGHKHYCVACGKVAYKKSAEEKKALIAQHPELLPAVASHKTCRKCGIEKPAEDFYKNKDMLDGLAPRCIACVKEYESANRVHLLAVAKKYRKNKAAVIKQNWSKFYKNNFEELSKAKQVYRSNNKELLAIQSRRYLINNREKIAQAMRNKCNRDPVFRLKTRISTAVCQALVANGSSKAGRSFFKSIEYSLLDLKNHLESQFTKEMTWENYGSYWHVHHIVPKAFFKYTSMDAPSFKACWSLDNLTPITVIENHALGSLFVRSKKEKEPVTIKYEDYKKWSYLFWAFAVITVKAANTLKGCADSHSIDWCSDKDIGWFPKIYSEQ